MCLALTLCLFVVSARGLQSQATRIFGTDDQDVALPKASTNSANQDPGALELLHAYLSAEGASQWQGVQATGSITYAGNEASPEGSATLTITRDGFTRLDVTNSLGNTSLRIRGASGAFQDVNGKLHRLPLRNARAGLFVYPFLLSPPLSEQQQLSLSSGTSQLQGKTFDKLSFTRPVVGRQASSRARSESMTTDLYLFPDTHLLYKSVELTEALDPSPERYIRVVTYEDYREVEGVKLPFRYTETINGQRSWVLQLTAAQTEAQTDPSYFTF